jgi:ArsR family transcriptional regulator
MKNMREPVFDKQLKAIANVQRLLILDWLKDPIRHFRPQVDGDLVEDGVCALLIGEKLGLAQPTTAQHLKLLVDAGLLVPRRIKKWTFYKRDEARIGALKAAVAREV